ncbi:MAG: ion transporter [Bacteroidetes bacterium]|nr:ion transporter [Bacteroidota bacterium]
MTENKFRTKLGDIIFESDTTAGKTFDVILLIAILLSVVIVLLDSVASYHERLGKFFYILEWAFTIIFTIEYFLRLYTAHKPFKYIFSFYGIIDLLAILPSYLSVFLVGSHYLVVIRILRLLRVFRVLKLARFVGAADTLQTALRNSRAKIIVFLEVVLTIVVIVGSMMYLIEGPENGFNSIPKSIYWAIVTLTTVGYGDIAPNTPVGQILASFLMITGYAIIAVPTGIITTEMSRISTKKEASYKTCADCMTGQQDADAVYCKKCGKML